MIDLPHVTSRVFGTPLMMARAKLEVILGALAPRFSGSALQAIEHKADPAPLTPATAEGIAVIPVVGTLVARSGYLDAASGLQAYGEIGETIAAAMDDPTVRGVILDMDSPGGEVGGLFDLVDRIRAIKTASGKSLWAVANESALSAAYAIASTADRLYVTRTAEVGSVGVVAVHVDETGADAKAGLAWTFVFAGERKVDANPHAPLSEQARAAIQADIDRLYGEFCTLVAANRRMSIEAVRATEAAILRGELAIRAGLADKLGTLDAAIAEMATEIDGAAASPNPAIVIPKPRRSPSMATNDIEPVQPKPAAPEPEPAPPIVSPVLAEPAVPSAMPRQPDPADALRAEYAEIAGIAAQAVRLGVAIDAADAMRKGIKPEALRRSILDALAARAEASSVVAVAPAATGESPIVRRAKERAAAART
ncbi:MAG: S49 family peptidase [Rhizobiales bacterium]|nr:S49 family peptidase [Hyphomicrobiales bacterium]MBI3674083.1 S49 family peptidase [Hyphomicrobiales bacterium]